MWQFFKNCVVFFLRFYDFFLIYIYFIRREGQWNQSLIRCEIFPSFFQSKKKTKKAGQPSSSWPRPSGLDYKNDLTPIDPFLSQWARAWGKERPGSPWLFRFRKRRKKANSKGPCAPRGRGRVCIVRGQERSGEVKSRWEKKKHENEIKW